MLKKIIYAGLICSAAFSETSAFNAGNINLENPYGLDSNEKILLENKKKVENLSKDYTGVDFKTTKALERIDGIQTQIDSLGSKTHSLELKLIDFEKVKVENQKANDAELAKLKAKIDEQDESIEQLKKALSELTNLIETLNESNSKLNEKIENLSKKPVVQERKEQKPKSKAAKFSEALSLYKNKNYNLAKEYFIELANAKYKPAISNFYLAQIAYEEKKYDDAIYYYKTSDNLYKKQNVKNPNLALVLLNTGNSLKFTNRNEQAQMFYKALKEQFPNSKEARSIH